MPLDRSEFARMMQNKAAAPWTPNHNHHQQQEGFTPGATGGGLTPFFAARSTDINGIFDEKSAVTTMPAATGTSGTAAHPSTPGALGGASKGSSPGLGSPSPLAGVQNRISRSLFGPFKGDLRAI